MIGNWKVKERVYTVPYYYSKLEKARHPVSIDKQQFGTKIALVWPWIQTRPARTECHRSTTCASSLNLNLLLLSLQYRPYFPPPIVAAIQLGTL